MYWACRLEVTLSPSGMFKTNLRFKSDLRSDRTIRMFGTTESRITRVDSGCFFGVKKKFLEVPDQRKNGYKMIHVKDSLPPKGKVYSLGTSWEIAIFYLSDAVALHVWSVEITNCVVAVSQVDSFITALASRCLYPRPIIIAEGVAFWALTGVLGFPLQLHFLRVVFMGPEAFTIRNALLHVKTFSWWTNPCVLHPWARCSTFPLLDMKMTTRGSFFYDVGFLLDFRQAPARVLILHLHPSPFLSINSKFWEFILFGISMHQLCWHVGVLILDVVMGYIHCKFICFVCSALIKFIVCDPMFLLDDRLFTCPSHPETLLCVRHICKGAAASTG